MGRMYEEAPQSGTKDAVMAFFKVDLTLAIPNVVCCLSIRLWYESSTVLIKYYEMA